MKKFSILASVALLSILGCNRDDRRANDQVTTPPSASSPVSPGMGASTSAMPAMGEADRALAQRVEEALRQDSTLASAVRDVQVHASSGEITLRGSVSNQQEKTDLGSKAQQVAGVTRVNNQLNVTSASR
jgi:osmotically-inducible protein OsmY